jgi:iron-sulfur cluster assembly accessory protein
MNIEIKFSVTDSALGAFKKALVSDNSLVRIAVFPGGCAGDGYDLGVVESSDLDPSGDILEELGGVRFVADKASAIRLDGITIDWITEDGKEGFSFVSSKSSECCRRGGCSS